MSRTPTTGNASVLCGAVLRAASAPNVGPVTRLRGTGRRESFDMERGAGGGAGERTLEQAFEQCVSRGRVMFERRVSGGRGALEQAFKQRVIRERERERERESE